MYKELLVDYPFWICVVLLTIITLTEVVFQNLTLPMAQYKVLNYPKHRKIQFFCRVLLVITVLCSIFICWHSEENQLRIIFVCWFVFLMYVDVLYVSAGILKLICIHAPKIFSKLKAYFS